MTETIDQFDIEALPVVIEYGGEVISPWDSDKPRTVDAWRVTIGTGDKRWQTAYYTGLGCRKVPDKAPRYSVGHKLPPPDDKGQFAHDWLKRNLKPVTPTVADVLCSLFGDAHAADSNFADWCGDYGYSDDSIKALNTYKACCDTARNLRRTFDAATREKILSITSEM